MPMYAGYIYKYFHGDSMLNLCAGWKDRFAGALSSGRLSRYVGFDPNVNFSVYDGYKRILCDFGATLTSTNASRDTVTVIIAALEDFASRGK
jgi:hypothetical protein